jgi:hypothetical protein
MLPTQRFECVFIFNSSTTPPIHRHPIVTSIATSIATPVAMAKAKCHAAHQYLARIQPVTKADKLVDDVAARNPRTAAKPLWADTTLEHAPATRISFFHRSVDG